MGNFEDDKNIGEMAEDLVKEALDSHWGTRLMKAEGFFKPWDFMDGERRVEVKLDRLVGKTGNIAIEYEFRGKPSGVKATRATHWAYLLGMEVWLCDIQSLLKWLRDNHGRCKKVGGGDNGSSKMLLLTEAQFKSVFSRVGEPNSW